MKRKRGHKKGKNKKLSIAATASAAAEVATVESPINEEESLSSDEENDNTNSDNGNDDDKAGVEAVVKAETPPLPPQLPERVVNVMTDGVIKRPPPTAVYGRVKVKLKTAAAAVVKPQPPPPPPPPPSLQPQPGSGEGQVGDGLSEGEKSGEPVSVEKEEVGGGDKVEKSGNSESEIKKAAGGIKIVSSSKSSSLSPSGGKESGGSGLSPEEEEVAEEDEEEDKLEEDKPKSLNKQELEASLEVIKKVMKMDAAEPFNVPVNPIELGIPDYFDVIDTPMDFGTIRSSLESGAKYMDSEDVYNDVRYIWDNCYKYNNKGDYIVDLMKRVKKNFMKYWMAAGLYTEQTKKISGGDSSAVDEPGTSGHRKKFKKGKGVKRHKDDCLCAICIMKRRRREREAREAQEAREAGFQVAPPRTKVLETSLPDEFKQENNSHVESPGADTSSGMETSHDCEADAEMEDGEMRPEAVAPQYDEEQKTEDDRVKFRDRSDRSGDVSEKSLRSDRGDTESHSHVETRFQDGSGGGIRIDAQKQPSVQPEAQSSGYLQQRHELLELEKKRQRLRLLETFRDFENPMLLGLCGTLFPNNVQTVWNGANSLVRGQRSRRKSDIDEAVTSFMNPSYLTANFSSDT